MAKKEKKDYEAELIREYEHWEYLKEFGGSDPFYDDATNMNLTRNHIIYAKKQLEELYGGDMRKYPDIYFRELPPITRDGYMARADEIRDRSVEVLDLYLSDTNFQYLLSNRDLLSKKEAEKSSIDNVIGHVYVLATALKQDDLITMRRHEKRPETYMESFVSCAEKVKKIISEKRLETSEQTKDCQMTLFQIGLEVGQCR